MRKPKLDETEGGDPQEAPLGECPFVGRYCVDRILGKGAFGSVYLADDTELKRRVAIEVPNSTLANPSSHLAEAQHVASLGHPNVVPVYDVGKTDTAITSPHMSKGRTMRPELLRGN